MSELIKEVEEVYVPYNELLARKRELLNLISDAEIEVHNINNELASRQHESFDEDSEQ